VFFGSEELEIWPVKRMVHRLCTLL
jgi:hypothetical protein